jgi:hypothetical protein
LVYCVINNRARFVAVIKRKFLRRKLQYYYLKEKFSRLRAQVKKAIKETRESFFQSLGSTLKLNPKRFYGLSSKLSRVLEVYPIQSRAFVRTILKVDNSHRHHIILHQCLTSTFIRYTPASWNNHPQLNLVHLLQYQVFHQLISPKKKCELQNLDPSKAHGPDGLPSRILKQCAHQLRHHFITFLLSHSKSTRFPRNES